MGTPWSISSILVVLDFSQSKISSACLKKLIPAVSIGVNSGRSQSPVGFEIGNSIGVYYRGDIGVLKNSSQPRLGRLTRQ